MTPREYRAEVQRFTATRRDESTRDLVQAWQTAALVGQAFAGKLEPLREILARLESTQERLTPAQQRTRVAMLADQLGIQARPLSEEAKRALMRLRES